MENLVIIVTGNGWKTPMGDDKPQSRIARTCLTSAANEHRKDGYTGKLIVTINRDGEWRARRFD